MDRLLRSAIDLCIFAVMTIVAFAKLTQKVEDKLKNLREWQEEHQVQSFKTREEVVNLKIMMVEQQTLSKGIRYDLVRILNHLERRRN